MPTMPLEGAPPNVMTKPAIDYRVSLAPSQIWDGTLEYFKARGFTTVVLIAAEASPYDKELQKIRQTGMYPILDIEHVIWDAGKNKSTPIAAYGEALSTWQKAGWNHVATEGGRGGDLDTLKDYFQRFTFFNCDQCGLWQDTHKQPYTTEMSWETYFPSEISSVQRGALVSYNLGKPQGITAGVWDTNNDCLSYDTYKALIDWSYSQGVGFTHFNVFFGLGGTLANYERLGLDDIISKLQKDYPPKPASAWPGIMVTSVRQAPDHQNSLVWDVANLGDKDAWVVPYAVLYNETTPTSGRVNGATILGQEVYNTTSAPTQQGSRYDWVHLSAGQAASIVSPATVPADTKSVGYNLYAYYNNSTRGWIYGEEVYTTVGCKNLGTDFWGLFSNAYIQVALVVLLIGVLALLAVLTPRLRQRQGK
ncbi:MAG: hypothetical protein ACXV5P_08790 [Halobacteriota archaeon]